MKPNNFTTQLGMPLTWPLVHTLTLVRLKDFNILLKINFIRNFDVDLIPHLDGIMFMGQKDPKFVKGIHPFDKRIKKNVGIATLLWAIIFYKVLKKGEPAYLTALVKMKPNIQIEVRDDVKSCCLNTRM